ncbi:MAG: peptidyl-prolyl cis-trans isomerase [Flavobacteriaceae bacterium]
MPRFQRLLIILFYFSACDHLPKVDQDRVVARAGSHYLYESELEKLLLPQLSKEDSTLLAQNIINTWAKKQLLYDQALINLEEGTQNKLNELVKEYELDLWARSYKESLVKSMIDTIIPQDLIRKYYKENQSSFALKETVVQMRYIVLPKDNIDLALIKERFQFNTPDDKHFLDSLNYQFNRFEIKDSIWFTKREFLSHFPIIPSSNFNKYLKKSQFFLFEDAIEVYLLHVNDYRLASENAPFPMVKNTIQKIVFNRKKLEFIKEFDQEILQDAIQTNKFEIYP